MAKVNISLPDGLLGEIDRRATAEGRTRSAFIQKATSHYVTSLDEEQAQRERAQRIGEAVKGMREIAKHMPKGVDGTAIIRRFRDMPEPWMKKPTDG